MAPSGSDTQYLSLGTPDIARAETTPSKERVNCSSFSYDNFELRANKRSASSELPRPDERKSPVVRRASSFKRKETPHRSQSPRYEKFKRIESPKSQSNDERKPKEPVVSNGAVVRRQSSTNRRPRTFHPDLFDSIQSTAMQSSPTEEVKPEFRAPQLREPRSPRRKTLGGTLSRMFGRDKDKGRDELGIYLKALLLQFVLPKT